MASLPEKETPTSGSSVTLGTGMTWEDSTDWSIRPEIRSDEWAQMPGAQHYIREVLDDVLVERLVWQRNGDKLPTLPAESPLPVGPGFVWFRFWFPKQQQVVEKYFDAQGQCLGMKIDICAILRFDGDTWATPNLLLDVWLAPDGGVTVRKERAFQQAVAGGRLSTIDVQEAERQIRRLTVGVARGRFPPPLARNWQIDLEQISKGLSDLG